MAVANAYNPKPTSVDSILQRRQQQADLMRQQGTLPQETPKAEVPQNQKVLGVEITPDYEGKSFFRKVGEDAAMLAYAVPIGLAQAVTHPIKFVKSAIMNEEGDVTRGALGQSVRDLVDPEYYKAHPLLGIVNLAGFIAPIAGAAKSAAIKTATRTAMEVGVKEAVTAGVEEGIVRTALKESIMKQAVTAASGAGKVEIAKEVVRNLLSKAGVTDDVAIKVGNAVSDNLFQSFSRQSTKMKVLNSIAHPVKSGYSFVAEKAEPLRNLIFGSPAKTAVAKIYGADVVAKNPEGFLNIERWAEAQAAERGIENTLTNRQRIMNEWIEQNSQWASLTPEQRVLHFENYAKQDLIRLNIHGSTGMDIVTTKSLPQNYVDAMMQTIKNSADDIAEKDLFELMKENFGGDFGIHEAEIAEAVKGATNLKEAMTSAVSKLGNSRSLVSFTKFSPEIQELAKQIEQTGYRIGYAPKNKQLSFVSDVFAASKKGATAIADTDIMAARSAVGRWMEKYGMSTEAVVEGAPEYSYRENFTQRVINELVPKYGDIFNARNIHKAGEAAIPAEKLFQWLDKNKNYITEAEKGEKFLPTRTVFDLKEADFVRAGFKAEVAKDLQRISNDALRAVPTSVVGMADKVVNFFKTIDKPFGNWASQWYDKYLKTAYKFRYDLSPFFAAQQWLETRINASLMVKSPSMFFEGIEKTGIPGVPFTQAAVKPLAKLGKWTAEKLAQRLEATKSYLPAIVNEPTLVEQVMVRDEVLGTLQKTMLDYTSSPDIINLSSVAGSKVEGIAGEAAFRRSVQSRNWWFARRGESSVRMATQVNRALANKFGFTLEQALDYTIENGQKIYKNPQVLKVMREVTQDVFHYKEGFLTSPLAKTLNVVWFPFRFQAKTVEMVGRWLGSLTPINRGAVINNWVHFANWAGTDEGIEWRRTNRNLFYQILNYSLAYGQIGQSIEAVTKGKIFGGNTGLIGGVPFGFMVNIARELAYLPSDTDQYDPKTGREFKKETPREVPSAAALSVALEQMLIQIAPGMPFYTLTGGVISGVSPRGWITKLIRMGVGGASEWVQGRDPTEGYKQLQRDFMKVPLDYSRLAE